MSPSWQFSAPRGEEPVEKGGPKIASSLNMDLSHNPGHSR